MTQMKPLGASAIKVMVQEQAALDKVTREKQKLAPEPIGKLLLLDAFRRDRHLEETARRRERLGLIVKGLKEELTEIFQHSSLSPDEWLAVAREAATPTAAISENTLPETAPAIWESRDRATEKDPIAFLRKHWGVYMDANILYQGDIARLGDETLVNTIRAWCSRQARLHPERAHDFVAKDILPPPSGDRSIKIAAGLSEEVKEAAYRLVQREKSTLSRANRFS